MRNQSQELLGATKATGCESPCHQGAHRAFCCTPSAQHPQRQGLSLAGLRPSVQSTVPELFHPVPILELPRFFNGLISISATRLTAAE